MSHTNKSGPHPWSTKESATSRSRDAPDVDAGLEKLIGQVNDLGQAYNDLEERLTTVEGADGWRLGRLQSRVTDLEVAIRELSNRFVTDGPVRKDHIPVQLVPIEDIAQELISRLGRGDMLSLVLQRQLHASLQGDSLLVQCANRKPPPTPTLTTTTSRLPTVETTSGSDLPLKRTRIPTAKAREASTTTADSNPPQKRPRLQVPQKGKYARKSSVMGDSLNETVSKDSFNPPAPTQTFKTTHNYKATALSSKKPETPSPEEQPSSDSWSGAKARESTESSKGREIDMDVIGFGDGMIIPPDVRRSTRKHRPVQREGLMHWRDVLQEERE